MRLIDADALIQRIDLEIRKAVEREEIIDYMEDDRVHVIDWLATQPTAYDVEKVISEIDKCSIDNTDWSYSANPKLASYYLSRTSEVIDIVKRGGVDEQS